MTDDVKDLLGRAFGQEPPLLIDRDEVIQQGRKRLRRRRVFEASGVVAAVLVVAVGAVTLTNLAGSSDQQLPPAASRTPTSLPGPGPGPVLPLPSTPDTPTTEAPLTQGSTVIVPPPNFPSRYQLTDILYNSGVVSRDNVLPAGSPPRPPEFHLSGSQYTFEADVVRKTEGSLQVTVDFTDEAVADCTALPAGFGNCAVTSTKGVPVVTSDWLGPDNERRTLAMLVLADGTRVAALASNMSAQERKIGKPPDGSPPVLDDNDLCVLITKVGLSAR